MQITSEAVEPRQVQLTIVVPPERIERAMNDVAQTYARRQRVPGYRPGKVPLARVVALVGEEPIREAAVEALTEQIVREAIRSEGLRPGGPASVEVVTSEPLTVKALVPLQPLVELGDYHAVRVPGPAVEPIGADEVAAVIDGWRRDMATLQPVERPAAAGDTVRVELVGRLAERIVHEDADLQLALTPEAATAAVLPTGIVDELVGLAAGQDHTFTVRYSEYWAQPELQGQEVRFEVRVKAVSARVAPDLDDKLAHDLAGAENVDELRARVRSQLQLRKIMTARDEHVAAAVDALVAASVIAYPPAALDLEVAGILADIKARVERQGFTWEKWLELQNRTEDDLWAEVKPEAEARLKRRLAMTEFVRLEGIDVRRGEIDAEVRQLTESLSPSARRGMPDVKDLRRSTGARLLSNRAVARLLSIVSPGETAIAAAVAALAGEDGSTRDTPETDTTDRADRQDMNGEEA